MLTSLGCPAAGVALRADGTPGPEKCSEEALKTMRILRMHVSDAADVELDANQIGARPITLYEGPVESVLDGSLGTLEPITRLYGRVWTTGPQVVIRYYEAKPPDGDTVPICAVARLGDGQLRKRPESKPGTAIIEFSNASVFVVDAFR
ncbi:MAG TPA: serine/threonine protein kinase [Archangium sp.]|uniref:serine/threonine protein kinase n=1 Tax=Archangium sp. TaxID=1872627 RepID=UPI002E37B63D|nr:serine/threonine protein kinase [Archangium sp.]HEX5754186.1 serine/threonine protein kinase [Archangium sp.]